jgi:hypothetical protein
MRRASPKYVPREWLLAEAYLAAERGDAAPLAALQRVLANPFDEQVVSGVREKNTTTLYSISIYITYITAPILISTHLRRAARRRGPLLPPRAAGRR